MKILRQLTVLLPLCLSLLTAKVEGQDLKTEFVKRKGTQFELGGKPFYFQGTNFYRLGVRDRYYSDYELDQILGKLSKSGIKVVRFWGFSCETPDEWTGQGLHRGGIANPPLLDRYGRRNETAFAYLDKVVAKAGDNGLKIILPMVNFEHEYCGMEWWNHVYGDQNESKQAFYCNGSVKKAYKSHVSTLLNRRNTYSGRVYRDDPSIMAIELANEPHTEDYYETSGQVDASCRPYVDGKPGTLVNTWLKEMSEYVRSLDSKHLISTGEEGYRVSGAKDKHQWIHDGSKGEDFDRNIALPLIDFATVHLYPDNWTIPASTDFFSWFVPHVLKNRAAVAHAANKPIVLEETGFSEMDSNNSSDFMRRIAQAGYFNSRAYWLSEIYKAANEASYAGTMIWQVVPLNDSGIPYDDDLYTFPANSAEGSVVFQQAAYMNSQSGQGSSSSGTPSCSSSAADPDGDGWGWEGGRSCRVTPSAGTPSCASSASDPDGDGWGWENSKSCRVTAPGGNNYPRCSSASSDPDGDGWGWENGKSCRVR